MLFNNKKIKGSQETSRLPDSPTKASSVERKKFHLRRIFVSTETNIVRSVI